MASLIIWFVLITLSLSGMILAAGAGMPMLHMILCGIVSVGIALVAIYENVALRKAGASKNEIAASTSRSMGFVYGWGALGIAITYLFILQWHEWWHFMAAFAFAAVLCLVYANILAGDEAAGREDSNVLQIGRTLTWVQFIGMLIAMIGMIVDGKLTRYLNPKHADWAAQNIFFFGALGLTLISAYALWRSREDATGAMPKAG